MFLGHMRVSLSPRLSIDTHTRLIKLKPLASPGYDRALQSALVVAETPMKLVSSPSKASSAPLSKSTAPSSPVKAETAVVSVVAAAAAAIETITQLTVAPSASAEAVAPMPLLWARAIAASCVLCPPSSAQPFAPSPLQPQAQSLVPLSFPLAPVTSCS